MDHRTRIPEWVFNLENDNCGILRRLADGFETRIFAGENVMLSFVRIEPYSEGKIHQHPEEQWGVLLEGECVRIQSGEEIAVRVGDFWQTPGDVPHGIRTGKTGALVLDIFSPPRPEYRKTGQGFGEANGESLTRTTTS